MQLACKEMKIKSKILQYFTCTRLTKKKNDKIKCCCESPIKISYLLLGVKVGETLLEIF